FFKKTVALVMLWKNAERIVRRQPFEGYRHNIVTYTLAWIHELTDSKMDLNKIWREQKVHDKLLEAIEEVCYIVNEHIRETEKNITEWCKKEECWIKLKEKHYNLPVGIEEAYIAPSSKVDRYDPGIKAEAEVIDFCKSKGSDAWWKLAKWLKERQFLSPKARSQCGNMGQSLQRGSEPSYFLSRACKKAWEDAEIRGWKWDGE
ncbi:MAG: AIPR family protein, partial [Methanophagales archaeon]|nr:AIPR family protein [Methanophagales archaeon]